MTAPNDAGLRRGIVRSAGLFAVVHTTAAAVWGGYLVFDAVYVRPWGAIAFHVVLLAGVYVSGAVYATAQARRIVGALPTPHPTELR